MSASGETTATPKSRRIAPRQVLADHVYDDLMASLVDGSLEAGDALNIDALARELEVSQTPIREALARLEATGLVRRTALKGYRVAPLFSTQEIIELMDARSVLEPVNAFLSCSHSTGELVDELAKTIDDLAAAPRGPSFETFRDYWQADERFHRLIAEHADNRFLLAAYSSLGGQVQRFRLFGGLGVTDADHAITEHNRILDAFIAGDAEGAREAMAAHVAKVKTRAVADRLQREQG
ncbi:MAG: GntR family transcriptional regulator [Burkholderiaceae bacterium]|nr:GntR family transcriptional regulator [Microbacteriaceae bacterium]